MTEILSLLGTKPVAQILSRGGTKPMARILSLLGTKLLPLQLLHQQSTWTHVLAQHGCFSL